MIHSKNIFVSLHLNEYPTNQEDFKYGRMEGSDDKYEYE